METLVFALMVGAIGMVGYYAVQFLWSKFGPMKKTETPIQGGDWMGNTMRKTLDVMEGENLNNDQVVTFAIYLAGECVSASGTKKSMIKCPRTGKTVTVTLED